MKDIHIGSEIKKAFEESGFTVAEFSRRINKSRENTYSIFSRKSIDTDLLAAISVVLSVDFFQLFTVETIEKETKYKQLEKEVELLREINVLLKKENKSKKE